ncbi:LysM peptidoglycan-binding domain-containing protein [Bacillus sp. FJAT-29790]|uniref:LysM peptidoglycan-binding domain-containing protein n=1 Tax=Bacillus sp. FJAT-29790 TaxID=1895002 RepID=UPI001C240881|nr:LysM peptidoglycan-binding domain-containing protein [Bacillus sp. FJAT-29790]MBU8878384.1 LysM peptidoglycan-binding domain-containing protein [Bacillus sp. FJAT-29790]
MAIHVVQYGDTLWSISKRYNVTIQTILNVNGIPPDSAIIPGLSIYIPDNRLPIRSVLISQGDTLWNLAKRYKTNISFILVANKGITPKSLYVGQKINIPSPVKRSMQTLGFIIPYSAETFIPVLSSIAKNLTYLAVVSYSLTNQGHAYLELDDTRIVAESKRLNVKPLLMIRNFEKGKFSPELIGQVLENSNYRVNLINSLLNFIKNKGYEGVSIDFEFIPPPRRQDFNLFLIELKRALGPLILHVNVHAKTKDIPSNWIIGAYDYKAIGDVADIVAVMTIDYGYPTGPPNPVSPNWWIEEVIQYSIGLINPRKLQIALPLYGYDWRKIDNSARAYSLLGAQNLALSTGAVIQYDLKADSPWFTYWKGTDEHIVWFDDIRSFNKKYKLIDQYRLLGTTYWQLSLSFPQNWAFVEKNFIIVK